MFSTKLARILSALFFLAMIVGCAQDGKSIPDEQLSDGVEEEVVLPSGPTWGDCRHGFVTGSLDLETTAACDALHLASPEKRRYGIRWVYLTPVANKEAFEADWLGVINRVWDPVGFEFFSSSQFELLDAVVPFGTGSEGLSLEELASDIAAHLGIELEEPDEILQAFQEHMATVGVASDSLAALVSATKFRPQRFLQLVARMRPEEIHVYVAEKVADVNAGGESGPPVSLGSSLLTNIIEIKAELALPKSTPALPHELGHYFGLKHPHVKQSGEELDTRYDYEREMNRWYQRNPGIDPFELLREYLGDDYSFDPSGHYLPYNASSAEGAKFEAFRSAVMKFYLRYSYLYRGQLQEVATLADFETMGSAGEFMYHKNWVGDREADGSVPGNNCHWDAVSAGMICEYPEFDTVLDGSDSLVDGTIYLEGGSRNNIMSYIRFPEWNIEDPQCIFTEAQIKVIRLHANVAGLGGRRNFLQSYVP